jgi:transcription-repair coupling factor (superfamily II helicase)
MNIRRQMKSLLIMNAVLKHDELEIKFHPEAPIDGARLRALVDANRPRMRLRPNGTVLVTVANRDYEELFAEIEMTLQALAACEKLEASTGRAAGVLAN